MFQRISPLRVPHLAEALPARCRLVFVWMCVCVCGLWAKYGQAHCPIGSQPTQTFCARGAIGTLPLWLSKPILFETAMGVLGAMQKIVVADAHALRGRWACARGQVSVGGVSHEAEGEGRGRLSPARDTTSPKMCLRGKQRRQMCLLGAKWKHGPNLIANH